MSLLTMSNRFNIVISDKEHRILLDDVARACDELCGQYAFIIHDKDTSKETGELKTLHLHVIIFNTLKRKRVSSVINHFSNVLGINPFAVQCDVTKNIEGAIQYLIHKNDKEKYQYDPNCIITNIKADELNTILTCENNYLSFDRLIQVIQSSKNLTELIEQLGLSYYHIYRNTIKDIWNELKK